MSNGGIGVPGPEEHYCNCNSPTVFSYHLLDLAPDLIQPLVLNPTHPHNRALPPLRWARQQLLHLFKGGVEDRDVG